jgi:hypothetical protein
LFGEKTRDRAKDPPFNDRPVDTRLKCSREAIMHEDVKSRDSLSKAELDRELNDALKGTFPASDPVTISDTTSTEPDRPIGRKPALLDKELARELAKHLTERAASVTTGRAARQG